MYAHYSRPIASGLLFYCDYGKKSCYTPENCVLKYQLADQHNLHRCWRALAFSCSQSINDVQVWH